MDGLPVTIRLLDPPLHEFLPDLTELSVRVALAEARGERQRERPAAAAGRAQAARAEPDARPARRAPRAWSSPACSPCRSGRSPRRPPQRQTPGGDPQPEIMIPLVGAVQELEIVADEAERVLAEVASATGVQLRAADRHDDRAAAGRADRRPDRRGRRVLLLRHQRPDPDDLGLLPRRRRGRVLLRLPGAWASSASRRSRRIDSDGVGRLVRIAHRGGRATRPDLKLGVCGEHGGDPDSVHFFHEVGLDYVSCSPFRVPVARLEAGRVVLSGTGASAER